MVNKDRNNCLFYTAGVFCNNKIVCCYIMLTSVRGYYDGAKIVVDEEDKETFMVGDEVIVTIIGRTGQLESEFSLSALYL